MRRGIVTGASDYEVLPDRWPSEGHWYPDWPPARVVLGYWGSNGTLWGDFAYFDPMSRQGVVHDDRDTIRWYFDPLIPDFQRTAWYQVQTTRLGLDTFRMRRRIQLNYSHPLFLYRYVSEFSTDFHLPRQPFENVDYFLTASQWQQYPNSFPPPTLIPRCPYDITPAYWFLFGAEHQPAKAQVYDAFTKY